MREMFDTRKSVAQGLLQRCFFGDRRKYIHVAEGLLRHCFFGFWGYCENIISIVIAMIIVVIIIVIIINIVRGGTRTSFCLRIPTRRAFYLPPKTSFEKIVRAN